MNQKLQDLLMHNEKVKDECLKKVLVYKDKYQDYKAKVKRANSQITVLTQRVARFELERGIMSQVSKQASPDKGRSDHKRGASQDYDYGDDQPDDDDEDYEHE